jgi:hypothetical protein
MQLVVRGLEKEYWLEALGEAAEFRAPLEGPPYVCLLWASSSSSVADRAVLTRALVASNCVYAVCGGVECEAWHDMVDEAAAEANRFVMTTWHSGESPEDLAHFFVWAARPDDDLQVTHHLIVVVGANGSAGAQLAAAVRGEVLGERAV